MSDEDDLDMINPVSDRKNDNEEIDAVEQMDDLGGFANYLAPYALALLGSLAVTAAFFRFILLDY